MAQDAGTGGGARQTAVMVLEITTFRLCDESSTEDFLAADKAVQTEVFPNTKGYLRRTTARNDDGEWLVVVLWASEIEIDEFNARVIADPAQEAFDALIARSTIRTERYEDVGGYRNSSALGHRSGRGCAVAKPRLSTEEVSAFLRAHLGDRVADVEPISGGFWSSAFAYRLEDREFVARFGSIRAGFEADLAAMAYNSAFLPVPAVLEIGDAFGESFALSVRHYGRFLETVTADEAAIAGPTVTRLLGALFRAPDLDPSAPRRWRHWLLDALGDHPDRPTSGWRNLLAAERDTDRLFVALENRIGELVDACPERRDLLHGDLLHANVLISQDASEVTAVFSWKCSERGDFLFDTAWCTFWGSEYPGIAALEVFQRVLAEPWATPLVDAAERHHAYELQIGATHLGWLAWVGDREGLDRVAAHTAMLLERGPSTAARA